jgi:hypothetical protein
MAQEDIINASLLTLGGAFVGYAGTALATNFWYAVMAAVIGTAIFWVRELIP